MKQHLIHFTATFGVVFWMAGCGGSEVGIDVPENLVPVTGVVTLDGQPLEGATVIYHPPDGTDPPRTARGVTDADGRYELLYAPEVKGAVPGTHRVQISKTGADEMEVVPEKYSRGSVLTAEVTNGEEDISFQLESR